MSKIILDLVVDLDEVIVKAGFRAPVAAAILIGMSVTPWDAHAFASFALAIRAKQGLPFDVDYDPAEELSPAQRERVQVT